MSRGAWRFRATIAVAILLLAGCTIDRAAVEVEQPTQTTRANPAVEPTAIPAPPPTPAFEEPTPVPPTPEPIEEPTPEPQPTAAPEISIEPVLTQPGPVAVDSISFILSTERLVSRLPGHLLVYLDSDQLAEVDIFTPIADPLGSVFANHQAVIDFITSDSGLAALNELAPVTIAGSPTRVFEGTADALDRSFYTHLDDITANEYGWFAPARMQLWVIDSPTGTVIVSAEALEDPGQFTDAVRLATEVLSTIEFG